MEFIKWTLIIIGGVVVVLVGGCFSTIGYFATAPAEKMSLNDLNVGSRSQPGEREALAAACNKKLNNTSFCACVVEEAEYSMSRFERLGVTAAFDGNVRRIVGYAKGLTNAGARAEDIEDSKRTQTDRIGTAMRRCAPQKSARR